MNRAKTDPIQNTIDLLFSKGSPQSRQPSMDGLGARPGFKPTASRFELRADETTRLVREITDTAAEQRHAKVAILRAARLKKEADEHAAAALLPPKKASRSRKSTKVLAP